MKPAFSLILIAFTLGSIGCAQKGVSPVIDGAKIGASKGTVTSPSSAGAADSKRSEEDAIAPGATADTGSGDTTPASDPTAPAILPGPTPTPAPAATPAIVAPVYPCYTFFFVSDQGKYGYDRLYKYDCSKKTQVELSDNKDGSRYRLTSVRFDGKAAAVDVKDGKSSHVWLWNEGSSFQPLKINTSAKMTSLSSFVWDRKDKKPNFFRLVASSETDPAKERISVGVFDSADPYAVFLFPQGPTATNTGSYLGLETSPNTPLILTLLASEDAAGVSHISYFYMPSGGGAIRPITDVDGKPVAGKEMTVSPDGGLMAYVAPGKDLNGYVRDQVWTCALDLGLPPDPMLPIFPTDSICSRARQMTFQEDNHSPSWTPDGKYLLFGSRRNGDSDLFMIPSDRPETKDIPAALLPGSSMHGSERGPIVDPTAVPVL